MSHPGEGHLQDPGGVPAGDLPQAPSRRAPHRGLRRDPASTACSLTPAAMTCPRWAGISSTRSWPCGPGCPARSWPPRWPTPAPARSWPRPARPSPGPRPRSWRTTAWPRPWWTWTGTIVKLFSNQMVDMNGFVDFDPEECGITEKVRFAVLCELLDQCGRTRSSGRPWPSARTTWCPSTSSWTTCWPPSTTSTAWPTASARRRHRPPGQPPPALRGRAAAEPVPHRLFPHGAGDPGADDHPGPGHRHPPVPDQHPARHRRHQGVLRLLPPEPVHGPDQPPGRADPQAAYVRPGPRRPVPGPGHLRRP